VEGGSLTIYLDVILLENLCMNYIILFATGIIYKAKISSIRIGISSLIGGLYAILSFVPILEIYSKVPLKILLSVVMVYISFKPPKFKILVKELIVFYLVSFVFGGCAFALLYFIKPQDILLKNGFLTGTYPLKIALLGGIVGFVIVNITFKIVKGKITKKDMLCEVTIYITEKQKTITSFIDTGNLLKDPISDMPVIVVESVELEGIVPNEIIMHLSEILDGKNTEVLSQISNEHKKKLRIIPFSSLGKQNGLLLGFIADKVEIKINDVTNELTNVIIGLYDRNLTKNGAYTGLVGIDIMERCGKNEYFANIN
jgi:stage II sporulation protein GA (sporulation sigma-E factor processing peptidase)